MNFKQGNIRVYTILTYASSSASVFSNFSQLGAKKDQGIPIQCGANSVEAAKA